jgi:hypothetical protein
MLALKAAPLAVGEAHLPRGTFREEPPSPGAKPCFLVPKEKWSDGEWLVRLADLTADEIHRS